MKPVCLTMCAFGSFPGKEVIQFDALGDAPLFLINGPTGSGKTTILDAICFALYGETTGEEREARQMRCDFADAEALTEVELVFDLADRRYHIRRVPEQQRPKARGEGTTTQAPEAQLWKLSESEAPQVIVSSKVREATIEVEKLTGLTVEQFRQVMVLPQGKFRQLLLAESKDREHIFGQLFQTHIYKDLEGKLKAKANAISLEVKNNQQLQLGVLEGAGLSDVESLDSTLKQEQEALALIKSKKETSLKSVQKCEEKYQQEKSLEQAYLRFEKTQQAVDQLLLRQQEIAEQRQRIQFAESAERIQSVNSEMHRYQDDALKSQVALNDVNAHLKEAEKYRLQMDEAKAQARADVAVLEENKQSLVYLQSLVERLSVFLEAQKKELVVKQGLSSAVIEREKAETVWGKLEANKKQLHTDLSALQTLVGKGEELPLQHAHWQKQLLVKQQSESILKIINTQQKQLELLKIDGERLKAASDDAVRNTQTLRLIWHRGQAAVLAKELMQGEPCIVCGSAEHPAPAGQELTEGVDRVPTNDELEKSREQEHVSYQQLLSGRENYAKQLEKIKSSEQQYSALCDELGEFQTQSLNIMQTEMQTLTEALSQWQQHKQRLHKAKNEVEQLLATEQQVVATLEQAKILEAQNQSEYASAGAVLQQTAQEMPKEYRLEGVLSVKIQVTKDAVQKEQQRQNSVQKQWETAMETLHSLTSQQKERQSVSQEIIVQREAAKERWLNILSDSKFATEEEYRASSLDQTTLTTIRQSVQLFDTDLSEQQGALKEQREFLANTQRPNLSEIEQLLDVERLRQQQVDTEWLTRDKRVSLLLSTQKTLGGMQKKAQKLDTSFALYGTLSSVANGQSYEKVSLQRFVLGVLLDDVLVEASHRLNVMSKGRYALLRKTEKTKGNKASGLELMVDDAYTGVQRSVATLSGGESFMAALSLALGLSDVVQAYSGGIRLDVLFIDEGFGSLDPESLELAIRTLLDLQAAGRMVGVISHVSDLKEQIPLRLDVIASHRGSHTQLSGLVLQ